MKKPYTTVGIRQIAYVESVICLAKTDLFSQKCKIEKHFAFAGMNPGTRSILQSLDWRLALKKAIKFWEIGLKSVYAVHNVRSSEVSVFVIAFFLKKATLGKKLRHFFGKRKMFCPLYGFLRGLVLLFKFIKLRPNIATNNRKHIFILYMDFKCKGDSKVLHSVKAYLQ